jgi:hypothetical protein
VLALPLRAQVPRASEERGRRATAPMETGDWWSGPGPAAATKAGGARGGQLPFGIGLRPSYVRGQAGASWRERKRFVNAAMPQTKSNTARWNLVPSDRDRLTADQREWRNLIQWCTSEVGARQPLVNTPEPRLTRGSASAAQSSRHVGRSSISVTAAVA